VTLNLEVESDGWMVNLNLRRVKFKLIGKNLQMKRRQI